MVEMNTISHRNIAADLCARVSTRFGLLFSVVLLLSGAGSALADSEQSAAIYNKVKLLDWLVHDSPVTKRIETSGDEEAAQQLKRAQDMWEQAVEHSEREEYELAEVHIDAGLKLMTRVSRKFKDQDREKQARIDLYKQVRGHVDMFVTAFDRIAEEKGEADIGKLLDREKLDSLMSSAQSQYDDGDLVMANHLMRQAADLVDNALSDARHKEVLLHELSFESLEEEYAYEINRNESYVKLIDLMQEKDGPSQASASYVAKLIEQNAELRKEADALADKGNYEESIAILEQGTDKLSRALRVSGAQF
jgi:hypothetical protein